MKKLIIVRHGAYDENSGDLNGPGRNQIEALGVEIKAKHTNGVKPLILTSTVTRAVQSAEILGQILETAIEPNEVLWSSSNRSPKVDEVLELLLSHEENDVVILVTHLEYTEELPPAFGSRVLEVTDFPSSAIEKGEAWIINCESRTLSKFLRRY